MARVLTSLIAAPPVLGAIWAGGAWLLVGLAIFVAGALAEFYALARRTGALVVAPVGYFLAGALLFLSPGAQLLLETLNTTSTMGPVRSAVIVLLTAGASWWEIVLSLTVMAPLVALLFRRSVGEHRLLGWTVTVVGAWYIAWFLGRVGAIRLLQAPSPGFAGGLGWVLVMVMATWACDTGAYLAGSWIGRRKMIPWISQAKTWEGATGGVIGSVLVVAISRMTAGELGPLAEFVGWMPLPIPVAHVLPLGLGIGICAILGDLAESMIKRDAGAKDAGGIFPGHGGIMDRIDSVLFTAPFVYYYAGVVIGVSA